MKKIYLLPLIAASLLSSAVVTQAQNLIQNGSFQTGDFSDWTPDAVSFGMYIVAAPSPLVDSGDNYSAQIAGYSGGPGSPIADTLSQTVATTLGKDYTLSFSEYIGDGPPITSLQVKWDGTTVYNVVNQGPYNQFQDVTVSVPLAGTGSDTVEFLCANDPSETYLDNVSLVASGISSVPDGGATISMFGLPLTGIAVIRRKLGLAR